MSPSSNVHIFGIRHHGPGSARSLLQALHTLEPDVILVEGPPDADDVLPLLVQADMKPPVALLIYAPDQPQQAVYYPFAVFSPEWQALHYGLKHQIPVRFMDLPQMHQLGVSPLEEPPREPETSDEKENIATTEPEEPTPDPVIDLQPEGDRPLSPSNPSQAVISDPLTWLAQAAGYSDGERWWEHMVEHRQDSTDLFAAILEVMTVLRAEVEADLAYSSDLAQRHPLQVEREAKREAYMRQTIRAAQKEGKERIAVVCGAWHAPALAELSNAKADTATLKGLPKTKVQTTWVPWTYGRLAMSSGYGAGIESPGWYHHLWQAGTPDKPNSTSAAQITISWMTCVARLLRQQDLDASSASVIEAVRLAEALAALRDRALPSLMELNEATQTVLCFGDALPMKLIHDKLIVGERLGEVPDETPMVPLQQDLLRQQKRLRLKVDATEQALDLDLRKPTDLERSHLLHRLSLFGIGWGKPQKNSGSKGTFHELWRLQWQPEFAIALIEAGIWGNTIEAAAIAFVCDAANRSADLPALTRLIDKTLLANLPEAIHHLMVRLRAEAAIASDVAHLMAALPPLANVLRYGNVRQIDTGIVGPVVDGLITRVCIGLPVACASLNDEAAATLYNLLLEMHRVVTLLQKPEHLADWQAVLTQLADQRGLHGLLAGRCCRLLLESGAFSAEETAQRLGLALSSTNEPAQSAAWVEGLLQGSGLLLLHNPTLWQVLDEWISTLSTEHFTTVLPLLRRTFSTFSAPERRQMGEQVRQGRSGSSANLTTSTSSESFDLDRADQVLAIVAQLLGIELALHHPINSVTAVKDTH
ncbi:hypothetical protein H6F90_10390 [Trichocoleus sp. FACHB-591]|uniref:DUF5682 family protein n=1 Tax=Trichocoleus sp. FACHB-591 TaxID=2692872 RepID=UPI0016847E70|nr:DUF5682 family protein [Trichocoleus sp. FACHB-591]MBD2095565.1 hypothetical protein [Trichocoleus sp. FACHB-591]